MFLSENVGSHLVIDTIAFDGSNMELFGLELSCDSLNYQRRWPLKKSLCQHAMKIMVAFLNPQPSPYLKLTRRNLKASIWR